MVCSLQNADLGSNFDSIRSQTPKEIGGCDAAAKAYIKDIAGLLIQYGGVCCLSFWDGMECNRMISRQVDEKGDPCGLSQRDPQSVHGKHLTQGHPRQRHCCVRDATPQQEWI